MTENIENQKVEPVESIKKRKYKTFKEYYADPEYRAKYLAKVSQKVLCVCCNKQVSSSNLYKHKQTDKHHLQETIYNSKHKPAE